MWGIKINRENKSNIQEVMMKKIKLTIEGMHCESCAKLIEMELKDKVNKIKIDSVKNTAEIDFDEKRINKEEVIKKINNLGYKAK